MFFYVAAFIVATAGSVVTIKTLVGYNQLSLWFKFLVAGLVVVGWTAPMLTHLLRRAYGFLGVSYPYLDSLLYFLFGLAFILFILLVLRDFLWFFGWNLSRLWTDSQFLNPRNPLSIGWANIAVVGLSLVLSGWAVWEAVKVPAVKSITFTSPKIEREYRLVLLTDMHLTRSSSLRRLKKIVEKTNALNPEAILLAGDIMDDQTRFMEPAIKELSRLKAPHGVYVVSGNHELYNGLDLWLRNYRRHGFKVLMNSGERLKNTRLYIGGIPDLNTAFSPFYQVDLAKTFAKSRHNDYRILLSHYTNLEIFADRNYDLQLSGHTHGGQIFPFHYLSWKANKYLAGHYSVEGYDLYVSRGAGYWGPPLRLLAPAEITEIILKPQKK